jgi:hypothetical protein
VTYVFQRRSAERQQVRLFSEQLRAERLAAYSGFVTAVTQFRRGQLEWINRRAEDPDAAAAITARAEAYRLRGDAQAALSQVGLVAFDGALVDAAGKAYETCDPMHYAADKDDLEAMNEGAKKSLRVFVDLASAEVRNLPG